MKRNYKVNAIDNNNEVLFTNECKNVKEVKNINPDNDDVMVAIGLALSLSMDSVHDVESDILTIKRVERHTSPWNARIYGMNNVK
jgi:hypothetical protein